MGGFKDLLMNAVSAGSKAKFNVVILGNDSDGDEQVKEAKELNYIELGTYLVSNEQNIERVRINLRD